MEVKQKKNNPAPSRLGFFLKDISAQRGRGEQPGPIEIGDKCNAMQQEFCTIDGRMHKLVYCRYKIVNGQRVYPVKARCFRFYVPVD